MLGPSVFPDSQVIPECLVLPYMEFSSENIACTTQISPEQGEVGLKKMKNRNFDEKSGILEKSPLQFPIVQKSNYWLTFKNRIFGAKNPNSSLLSPLGWYSISCLG